MLDASRLTGQRSYSSVLQEGEQQSSLEFGPNCLARLKVILARQVNQTVLETKRQLEKSFQVALRSLGF